ncbi:MAG: threonylcarbamoyl-AMP synthase [Hyphomicrobiales bacterium]|nr:threonylcarbamoyl-AMP synthase [Hyphomicrobiales bacterium]OQW81681.1 MAG: threonylcarbamoyl-AMP synthase [Proteobacteria bacterium ST_bin15]
MTVTAPSRMLEADNDLAIAEAALIVRAGQLIGLPTETVYGVAGDATSSQAVARIYAAKGRPTFNPLIVHVASLDDARCHGVFSPVLERLAQRFWPGPLTLVMPARADSPVAELARAGLATIALRVPAHPVARAVIARAGRPLAAPSANRSGHVTATAARHVAEDLGAAIQLILDGGTRSLGLESTILTEIEGKIVQLRAGALTRDAITAVLGYLVSAAETGGDGPHAPGMLAKHYAPEKRLRLGAAFPHPGEAFLGFGALPPHLSALAPSLTLSASGDLTEAAANLFAYLRALDGGTGAAIAVAPIPHEGLGEAINDRLARAALGR